MFVEKLLTIIMYHFVRDLARSRYPEIKGLALNEFHEQISYIKRYYKPIKMEELFEVSITNCATIPENAILLTFDDGYIDHFTNVFPILDEIGVQGSFFPPAKAINENRVLDVNKIHFILASVNDKAKIIYDIKTKIEKNKNILSINNFDHFYVKHAIPNRYDTAEVVFIKRSLQRELPEEFRRGVIDGLFRKFVTRDEAAFATELYMNPEQLACMRRHGMYIGSHGYDHYWLNTLCKEDQESEIDKSLEFLRSLGCSTEKWAMCYPYGGYNESLIEVVKSRGCRIGLAVEAGIADLQSNNSMTLPRLDTNDLPKQGSAAPNEWTLQVIKSK